MINKQSWQYKDLVQWYPMVRKDSYLHELVSGNVSNSGLNDTSYTIIDTPLGKKLPLFYLDNARFETKDVDIIAKNELTISFWFKLPSTAGTSVLINFDDYIGATDSFGDNPPLSNEYIADGVQFDQYGWEVLDESAGMGVSDYSSPNFLAWADGATPLTERIDFTTPISNVTFKAASVSGGTFTATAYNLIGGVLGVDSQTLTSATKIFSLPYNDISYIILDAPAGSYGVMDDFSFGGESAAKNVFNTTNNSFVVNLGAYGDTNLMTLTVDGNNFVGATNVLMDEDDFFGDKWRHAVFSIRNGLARGYVDGQLIREETGFYNFDIRTKTKAYFGLESIDGYMFDFRWYNRAWQPAEVQKYYNSSKERNNLYKYDPMLSPGLIFNSIPLYIKNFVEINDNVPLVTSGEPIPINNSMNLHTWGELPINSGATLFVLGGLPVNSGLTIHTYGKETIVNSTTLHTKSYLPSNSGTPLYMVGVGRQTDEFLLYVEGEGYTESGIMPLFTYASESGTYSLYNTAELYLYNTQTMDPRNELKLFVQGSPETITTAVNLVVYNDNAAQNGVPMYINGPYESMSGIPLYITTETGIYRDGSIQTNSSLLLYLNRDTESLEKSTSLFVKAKEPETQSCDFIIDGYTYSTNSATLYMEGSGIPDNINNSRTLYVRGGN